ncbi:MAG: potassium channel family protein [Rhodospirillales bacterium]
MNIRQPTTTKAPDEELSTLLKLKGRCSYVLAALGLIIVIYPYLVIFNWGRIVLLLLVSSIIISITYAIGHSRKEMFAAIVFAVVLFVLQAIFVFTGEVLAFRVGIIALACFLVFAVSRLLSYLMRRGRITADKLHAALAIYILGAFLWATLYTFVNHIDPGSFLVNANRNGPPDYYDMLYFSFTTLTSTGYGDLTPATRPTESLAILEQIAGVFYVAVLIARLSGLYPPGVARPK